MFKSPDDNTLLFYCFAAAVPSMLVGALFNIALIAGDSAIAGLAPTVPGDIMQAEFLAAASGILLILPLLVQVKSTVLHVLRLVVCLLFGMAMAALAYRTDGVAGILFYMLLVFVTYGGGTLYVLDRLSGNGRILLSLLRWAMASFAYVSLQLYFDLDSDIDQWKDTPAAIPFGAAFFYTLFALEVVLYPALTWHLERKPDQGVVLRS